MSQSFKNRLKQISIIRWLVRFLKSFKLPGFEGLSIYHLFEMYAIGIIKGAITLRASAVAFSFFMAIFPFLLFIIILIPYIPIETFRTDFLIFLETTLPPNTSDFFNHNIFENINTQSSGGLVSSVFILSMLLMANGVNAVFSAFENSYHQQFNRNFVFQYLYALGVSIVLSIILITTIIGFGYLEIYLLMPIYEGLNLGDTTSELQWIEGVKFVFFVLMVYLGVSVLYFFGTQQKKQSRFFTIGALLTTILVLFNSYFFGIYIENFSNYNQLYGSIGALLILMFYLWLNAIILLLGYELNASLNQLKQQIEI